MNLRHAAALALVGWYLMCPPMRSPCLTGIATLRWLLGYGPGACDNEYPNYDAVLKLWTESGEYDRVSECQSHQFDQAQSPNLEDKVICKCVATDDPRLAK